MYSFRDFIYNEHQLIGMEGNKYRVSFKMPKNKKNWSIGHFDDDTVYVSASSSNEAKKLALDWIKTRLEADETNPKAKKSPKINYLQNIDIKHIDMSAKLVNSWAEVVKLLEYAVKNRSQQLTFFDDNEYKIILDTISGNQRNRYLNKLGPKERSLLKKILQNMWESSKHHNFKQTISDLTKSINTAPQKRTSDAISPSKEQSSIYRQKLDLNDAEAILERIKTYPDAIREAKRLGITKQELDYQIEMRFGQDILHEKEMKYLFSELYKKIKLPSSHKGFDDDDPNSKFWRGKIDWERLAIDWLPRFGLETVAIPLPQGLRRGDSFGGASEYEPYLDWAVPFLYNLYRNGPPKQIPMVQRYKAVLEILMNDILQYQNHQSFEEIPF